jgi:hypothetical protein
MSGRTPINITSQTVYANVDESDDLFNVLASATFVFRAADILTDDALSGGGLARVSGATSIVHGLALDDTATFANAGAVTQSSGELTIGQVPSDSATARNDGGAIWTLADGSSIVGNVDSQFENLGQLEQLGGVSTVDANFYDRGGAIIANGALYFAPPSGTNRLVDGVIGGSGLVRFSGQTVVDDVLTLEGTVTLANAGVVTQYFGVVNQLLVGQTSSDAVSVRNDGGATWTLPPGAEIVGEGDSQFINLGRLVQLGGGSDIFVNFFDRAGAIVSDGTLQFDSFGGVNRFVDDTISGSGAFYVESLGVLVGSNLSIATTNLIDARIVGDVNVSSPTFYADDLSIRVGAVLSLTPASQPEYVFFGEDDGGPLELTACNIQGGGTIEINGDSATVFAPDVALIGAVTLLNSGNTTFLDGPDISTKPWTGDTVTIENAAGATWDDADRLGSTFNATGVNGTNLFLNNGAFTENSIDGASFGLSVENNGTMSVGEFVGGSVIPFSSSLTFDDGVTGTGTIDVSTGTVTFASSVASEQTLDFDRALIGYQPSLILDDPAAFAGTIAGFGQGGPAAGNEQIMLVSQSSADWQILGYQANSGGTGGMLQLADGAATAALNLTGSFLVDDFHATVSGSTTTITYSE